MKNSRSIIFFWVGLVVLSIGLINWYATVPGKNSTSVRIPAGTKLLPEKNPRLLVFLHPKCLCSEATMTELQNLLPELRDIDVTVVFRELENNSDWMKGTLFERAKKTKGISIVIDGKGEEAKLFGAHTSGHAVLTTTNGLIAFSGGLTPSRGHTGESAGKDFLLSWNRSRAPASFITDIFGCNLFKE